MAGFLQWRRDPAKRAAERAEHDRMIAAEIALYERRQTAEQEQREQLAADREREMREGLPTLPRDAEGPFCSRCRARQFQAVRGSALVTLGLLAESHVVECVPCGMRYHRR